MMEIDFVGGSDSAVRVDQIAAVAVHADGVEVLLLSGAHVLVRKTIEEFFDALNYLE